jgi:2-amino-4-hydroxy-6-hydroxymethyldihydropteridine diphosphokinase
MAKVLLSLGSNVGNRLGHLRSALKAIEGFDKTEVRRCSSVYLADPVGREDQAPFLNLAIEINTQFEPLAILKELKNTEEQLGRRLRGRWGPREIDIDILLYERLILRTPDLCIPHAELSNRRFVLIPLCEISPLSVNPLDGKTVAEMLAACNDGSGVAKSHPPLM